MKVGFDLKKVLYGLGILPVFLFLWISQNYETEAFIKWDEKMADALYGNEFIEFFHYFGETSFVMTISILVFIFMWLKQKSYRGMVFIVATMLVGTAMNQGLKHLFERPRPDILDQLDSFSFPSGHSMMGILYLFTLAFLFSKMTANVKVKAALWIGAVILFVLIGLSRVAGGRHFITDVLGGWSLGLAWFTLCVIWYESIKGKIGHRR